MSASPSRSPPSRAGRSPDRETPRGGDGDDGAGGGTIFVGNLNHDTSERRLRDFFESYGRVLSTKVVFNPETGRSKGFGFVKFEDARDADDAIKEADGKTMDGRTIKCNFAKYQPHRGQPPHAFRGGRGDHGGPGFARGGYRGDFRGGFRGRGGRFGGPPPFREGRRGRSRSPGRYSPGRYSPGRYSYEEGSGSPRSRSGSPPPKRRRPVASPPPRGDSPPRGGRAASRSPDSRSSASYSSTGSDDSRGVVLGGPPAAADLKKRRENGVKKVPHPVPVEMAAGPGTLVPASAKKELAQAKRREDQLTVRLAAMEAELATLRGSHGNAQGQIAEISERLVKSEEVCKQYKKWLKAMAEYARALLGAKQAVLAAEEEAKGREEDLSMFLEQADTFMLAREKHRRRRGDKDKETLAIEAKPAEDAMAIDTEPAGPYGAAPEHAAPVEDAEVNGSWAKEEEQADDVSAKFKPGIKFKLAA